MIAKNFLIPKRESSKQIAMAGNTLGVDELLFVNAISKNPKDIHPMKAVFGKKHIKFKTPPIQWEQKYQNAHI